MVRVACLEYGFMILVILILVINPSGALPHLTNISENIVWTIVTNPNEIYKDPETGQKWTTFKINIPAGKYSSRIINDVNENTSFYWKSDKKIGKSRLYRSIEFYKCNEKEILEYDPKTTNSREKNQWILQNFSEYTIKNELSFNFHNFGATIWVAFVPESVPELPITIQNKPPNKPNFDIQSDVTLASNETLCIRANVTDPDRDIIDLIWVWGDGGPDDKSQGITSGGNDTKCHSWKEARNYSIVIMARDSKGNNNSSRININILPPEQPITASVQVHPPTKPELNVSSYGVLWLDYNLFIRASSRDPNNDSINYSWDWGDESHNEISPFVPSGDDYNQSHLYRDPGNYTITITASTQKGGNNSSTINLTVLRPKSPKTPLGECIGYVNSSSKYSTSLDTGFTLSDGAISFKWNFDDVLNSTNDAEIMHKWLSKGPKKVKVRALDIQGNPGKWSDEINVDIYEPRSVGCNQDIQEIIDNASDYTEISLNCSEYDLNRTLTIIGTGHISIISYLPNRTTLNNNPSVKQIIYIKDSNCINISNLNINSDSNNHQFAVIAVDTCDHCTIKNTNVDVKGNETEAIHIVNGSDNKLKDLNLEYKNSGLSYGIIIENSIKNWIENFKFDFSMRSDSFNHINFENLPKNNNNRVIKSDTNQELIFSNGTLCSVIWPSNAASLESYRKDGSDCPFYNIKNITYLELILE